jgi:outer membrane protein assembly factor BamB
MRLFSLALIVVASAWPAAAVAQFSASGLISPQAARQFGLERMWFTQLHVDRGRGRIAGLHMHVSDTEAHTVFQITHNGQRYVYSQRDRDAFGKEIGVEGAKALADKKLEDIKTAQTAAGKTDPLPEIQTFVVPKITLYSASERGTIHSLDGETGRTHWTKSVGNPNYPTTAPAANDKFVALCNGSTLYTLLASDGSQFWSRRVVGAPGAGPALSDVLAFVPMIGGQVETYDLEEPKRPVAVYKSFGRAMVQPIVSANSVAWPTDGGNLYVGLAREPGMRFRMQAKDAINSAPAFLGDKVFATSLDGYLYCVQERRGNVLWRFTTGEPISHSPIALDKTVYVITDRGHMFAIGVDDGQERWVQSGIRCYVAGNNKRLYCRDLSGNLTIIEAESGSKLGTIAVGDLDLPFINVETDRIILAASTGLVQCFREARMPWPVVHFQSEAAAAGPKPVKVTPPPQAGGAAPMPMGPDPLGGAPDPFGAPAKPATPMPMPPAGGQPDPFGAPPAGTPAAPATPPAPAAPAANPFG